MTDRNINRKRANPLRIELLVGTWKQYGRTIFHSQEAHARSSIGLSKPFRTASFAVPSLASGHRAADLQSQRLAGFARNPQHQILGIECDTVPHTKIRANL
jgi:hypothetical protein